MNSLGAWFQNTFFNRNRYRVHQDAVIVSCFYNPQNNPYRLVAFHKWYRSIKHLPHRIIECLIGPNAKSQLPRSPYISQVSSKSLLWHKETLLNKLIKELPAEFKYVFWIDADVLFTNLNWVRDGVAALKKVKIIQPFEYCVHLKKGEIAPDFDLDSYDTHKLESPGCSMGCSKRDAATHNKLRHPQLWKSFCAVYVSDKEQSCNPNSHVHGHVGFAWGASREVLDKFPLYDRALIGGSDHIIAHAAAGHIPNSCVRRAMAGDIEAVEEWSQEFYREINGSIGFVPGDLYHIWHGDIKARDYYRIVPEFSNDLAEIGERDDNGLFVDGGNNKVVKKHYPRREASEIDDFDLMDTGFFEDMGYYLADIATMFGQPTYDDPVTDEPNLANEDSFSATQPEETASYSIAMDEVLQDTRVDRQEIQNALDTMVTPS